MADQTVDQTATAPTDTLDKLQGKLGQLSAMLNCIYGEGGESFRTHNDQIQDDYIWACADLAEACGQLAKDLSPAVFAASEKKEASHV